MPTMNARLSISERHPPGPLTQGSVFSCAKYHETTAYGIVITARCDLAHVGKVEVVNYIPCVPFQSWYQTKGRYILGHRLQNDAVGQMRKVLNDNDICADILDYHSPTEVLHANLAGLQSKGADKIRKQFQKLIDAQATALHLLSEGEGEADRIYIEKPMEVFTKDCVLGRVNGYYYLDTVLPAQEKIDPYIADLRDVRSMPISLADHLSKGLCQRDYLDRIKQDESWQGHLDMEYAPFAQPVSLITSPFIEHLVQAFTWLYSRIGLPDPDPQSHIAMANILRGNGAQS